MRGGRNHVKRTNRWNPRTAQACRLDTRYGHYGVDCRQITGFNLGATAGNRDLHHSYRCVSPVVALAQMVMTLTVAPGSFIRKDRWEKHGFTCPELGKGGTQ